MSGPPPKDPKLRQRRNIVSTRATLAKTENRRRRSPSLPDLGSENDWHPLTVAWWRDLWHSPMAGEFLRVDRHALYRMAALIDRFWKTPTTALAAEIRLEQQAFGLTPIDRRRLQWTVVNEQPQREKRPMHQPAESQDQEDPRKLLDWVVVEK